MSGQNRIFSFQIAQPAQGTPKRRLIPAGEIGPAHAAGKKRISGQKDSVAAVADAARRMAGSGEHGQRQLAASSFGTSCGAPAASRTSAAARK